MPSQCADEPSPDFVKGLQQFNQGEFFEQHETLEILWRAEVGSLRDLYRGLLQVGVGFLHLKRGNYNGAVEVLSRGLSLLPAYAPTCQGIDVARLIRETQHCYDLIRDLGPARLSEFEQSLIPQVHWASQSPGAPEP